jgi:hypothetical protein
LKKKVIHPLSFRPVLVELKNEAEKILGPVEEKDYEPWSIFFHTFARITDGGYGYLPPGDFGTLKQLCIDWMRFGLISGKSPEVLGDILERTGAQLDE